jgi:UDP-2,3-diacylglucosamine pyrophosphatase LpxH
MSPIYNIRPQRFRTIWISDIHLGFKGCRADFLLDFLKTTESEYLFLVGDIIDVWSMKKGLYWPQEHNNVIRTILGKAKNGTKVVYVPGNHDEVVRDYAGMTFGNVKISREEIHTTKDGRIFLIMHGDEFDSVVQCSKFVSMLGNSAYAALLGINHWINYIRRKMGFPYWSLAAYLKHKVKNAVKYISSFEHAVSHEAHRRHVDGLICGHIHRAEITRLNGVLYCNTGDWVESCTALVERMDGSLHLLHWADEKHTVKSVASLSMGETGKVA